MWMRLHSWLHIEWGTENKIRIQFTINIYKELLKLLNNLARFAIFKCKLLYPVNLPAFGFRDLGQWTFYMFFIIIGVMNNWLR